MEKFNPVSYKNVDIKDGFWAEKQKLNREVTAYAIRDRFEDTGRFEAFEFDYVPDSDIPRPHFFWDSDVAKWLESVFYINYKNPDPVLMEKAENVIDLIEKNQQEDGYFNIYHTLIEPELKFQNRDHHELYCLGHLIEAAAAYYEGTGKDRFINILDRYIDLVIKTFVEEKSAGFTTPGHEEIELALVKLYRVKKDEKYLRLASFFIDNRGLKEEYTLDWCNSSYFQSDLPLRKVKEAKGHAVRAGYLYSGMADVARETDDEELLSACRTLFEDITKKKMYISGGVGSSRFGEAYTVAYDLPNDTAYSETCAAIAMSFFADRLKDTELNSVYADVVEREMYNGAISGLSLNGKSFFYENPLEINVIDRYKDISVNDCERLPITERKEVFGCSCCPPNISRYIASVGGLAYSYNADSIIIHQFLNSDADIDGAKLNVRTEYPNNGKVNINIAPAKGKKLYIRIPGWCSEPEFSKDYSVKNGYAVIDITDDSFNVDIDFNMKPVFYYASPCVRADIGKAALMYGPVLYCIEKADNDFELFDCTVDTSKDVAVKFDEYFNAPVLTSHGYIAESKGCANLYSTEKPGDGKETSIKYIPYFGFANRGESDMRVWVRYK